MIPEGSYLAQYDSDDKSLEKLNLPFKIQVADDDATSGTIKISWCVGIETINYLAQKQITNPQVVIVVSPNPDDETHHYSSKEQRYVIPLRDLMAFIELRVAGKNRIRAFITHYSEQHSKELYLTRIGGRYNTDILSYWYNDDPQSDQKLGWSCIFHLYDGVCQPEIWSELFVDVPLECFAKEPPEWEKEWVNWLFRDKCIDQCHYRRRRIFAYTVQPLIMMLNLFWRCAVMLAAFSYLSRGLTLKYLLHPLTYDLEELPHLLLGGSYLVLKCKEDNDDPFDTNTPALVWIKYTFKKVALVPLMPIFITVIGLALFYGVLIKLLAVVIGAIMAILIIAFVASGAAKEFVKEMWYRLWHNSKEEEFWYLNKEEIETLSCEDNIKHTNVSSLPKNHRTIKLRFLDLKSKVCRPFSL